MDASNYLSCRVALLPRAISALIRCTTLVPVRHSRAVLRIPLPLASAERIAASFVASIPRPPDRLAALGALVSRPGKSGLDPFLDDRALELGKDAEHLKECPSRRGGCINRLLFEIEVASSGVEFAKKAGEILQGSAKTVYGPRSDDIDLAAHDLFQKPIEVRPFVATFGAADAFIGKFTGDDPSLSTTNRLDESLALVVNGLSIFR